VLTLLILLLVLETGISAGLVNLAAETIWKTLPLQGAFVLQAVDDGGNSKAATPLSIYTILRHVVANEADVFAWNQNLAQLSLPEGIQLVNVLSASPNILHILKIKPALGRLLLDEDGINVALISSRLWREQLYADNAVVGKELLLNNKHVTVIGVLDSPFPALIAGFPPDIILSLPSGSTAESVANVPVHIIGRLRGTFLPKALEQTVNTSWSTIVAATVPVTSTLDRWHKVAGSGVRVLDGRYGVNRLRDIVSAPFNVIFLLGISLLLSTSATVSIIIIAFSSRRGIRPQWECPLTRRNL